MRRVVERRARTPGPGRLTRTSRSGAVMLWAPNGARRGRHGARIARPRGEYPAGHGWLRRDGADHARRPASSRRSTGRSTQPTRQASASSGDRRRSRRSAAEPFLATAELLRGTTSARSGARAWTSCATRGSTRQPAAERRSARGRGRPAVRPVARAGDPRGGGRCPARSTRPTDRGRPRSTGPPSRGLDR